MSEEEIYQTCTRCKEEWPPDEEFYRVGKKKCRACEYEVRQNPPSRQPEARRAIVARRKAAKVSREG